METKWTISEHSENVNKLQAMNKCNPEWENHYKYEDLISEKLSFWEKRGAVKMTGSSELNKWKCHYLVENVLPALRFKKNSICFNLCGHLF